MNEHLKLIQLLASYKKMLLDGGASLFLDEELYKWEYISDNQNSSALEIIDYLVKNNLNIYDRARDSQTWKTLKKVDSQALEETIIKLKDESVSLHDRLSTFKTGMKSLAKGLSISSYANDERTAACFLSCWYPEKYTLYKDDNLYDPLCRYLEVEKKKAGEKYEHYLELIHKVADVVRQDSEIQSIFKEKTASYVKSDLLIAQTIVWCVFSVAGKRKLQGRLYWSGGVKWGDDDQTEKFIAGDYWQIGWKDKDESRGSKQAWANIKRVQPGDYMSFHTFGGHNDLTIHYLAEIVSVDEAKGKLKIKKLPQNNYFKGKGPKMFEGSWFGTLFEVTGEEAINTIFNNQGTLKNMDIPKNIIEYEDILKSKKNVILQGAPGTGKTYSTAALALAIIADKEPEAIVGVDFSDHKAVMDRYEIYKQRHQIEFCTFHQSMDYEDFVEGLRPEVVGDGKSVAYKVRPGIFKTICENAEKADEDMVDNFDEAWESLIEELNDNDFIDIPNLTNTRNHHIELNEYGSGLTERTIPIGHIKKGAVVAHSWHFSKEHLYNNYRGLPVVQASWLDNHSKAIVDYMEKKHGLKKYKAGSSVNDTKNYVLIIDEINRGYVSKIFGELITLLEKDKRKGDGADHHIEVTLPYSNDQFSVPSNVYIIGTMNTTDRTTGTLDYALRRRFAFITVEADPSVLLASIPESILMFNEVKQFIENKKLEDIDISDLMVGHSYFMATDKSELRKSIEYGVIPLIKEYVKDGILNCLPSEANEYFADWKELKAHEING